MTRRLPIFLDLKDQPILVIGGGSVAREKLQKLIVTGAAIQVVAKNIHPETLALLKEQQISFKERAFQEDDAKGIKIIISAVNEPAASQEISQFARRQGIFINAVDRPEDSDFFFAAQIERGPLQIAISTQGLFPGVARALRIWLEEIFPAEIGEELQSLGHLRNALRPLFPSPLTRMQLLREQLENRQKSLEKFNFRKITQERTNVYAGENS